jgi:transcriptional regulator with XRE-family HTH domain
MHDNEGRRAFRQRLKELGNKLPRAQTDVATKLGLQLSQLTKDECGVHVSPPEQLIQLAEIFGITSDSLLIGSISNAQTLNNVRLPKCFHVLSQCKIKKQETAMRLNDAVIVKHRVEAALTPVSQR